MALLALDDYPGRYALTNELHARPFPELTAPCRALHLAIKPEGDAAARDRERDRAHLAALLDRYGVPHTPPGANHYSGPLGRGFLTGTAPRPEEMADDDYRRNDPRYADGNYDANAGVVDAVKAVAAGHGVSAAQVALAWLLAQGDAIVPIPGSKRRATMNDSMDAADLTLSGDDLATLDTAAPRGGTAGPRYRAAMMAMVRL